MASKIIKSGHSKSIFYVKKRPELISPHFYAVSKTPGFLTRKKNEVHKYKSRVVVGEMAHFTP